jgi:TPR repeat protein
MADVFVSYARDDRARVEQLAKALEARGFNVWWDPELLPGEQYAQKLSQVLGDCKAVLVVWSVASTARPWVLDEASVGRDRGVLVPVLIEKVDAPLGFRQMQAEDLTGWPGPAGEENFERVVRALEGLRGAAAAPKPTSPFPGQPPKAKSQGFGFMRAEAGATEPKPKSNRWLLFGGGGALAVLALIAIGQIAGGGGGGGGGSVAPAPQVGEVGADKGYGLTKKELATLDMQKLVQTALQRTTIEKIEEGAKAGDATGQLLLCGIYDWGAGSIQADPDAARSWCEQAADQGQPFAVHYVGLMHLEGVAGYQKDPETGHKMIEKAAAAGDARAETYLGGLYLDGSEGYPSDDLKALSFYRSAAEQGYQDAQFSVAWIYENGRGVPKDYATALVWYQKLADEGSAIGTRGVGWMYYKGWATDQDYQKAKEYFLKASELGDGQASFNLGTMYEKGEGVPQDNEQALKYYRIASEQKFADADAALKRLGKGQ